MGKPYSSFKLQIGDVISTYGRNIQIIDKKYVDKIYAQNGKTRVAHRKYYKYRCLNCGNEDWILEYTLCNDKQHCGCNACCTPPKKVLTGYNDIATTDPWMIKYFVNPEDAKRFFKYSTFKVNMRCPDCGRIYENVKIESVNKIHKLPCICNDNISYPNKFMYAFFEQIGIKFETEKIFEWSDNRRYDIYFEHNGEKIICEQHGQQHYYKSINKKARTLEEEQKNDKYKYNLAIENGIDRYFVIDAAISNVEYIKNSITNSDLFNFFNITFDNINWNQCDEFASSNLAKEICLYKDKNKNQTLSEIANIFHVHYKTVLKYVKSGTKFGWCNYQFDDASTSFKSGKRITNEKPICCISDGKYYRSSNIFVSNYYNEHNIRLCARNIRSVCIGKRKHVNNLCFKYITQEEFNNMKNNYPELTVGNLFKLKEPDMS